ncbi:hypothetical protein K438DRAFT_1862636 [Mycena galopus ATCC 62051]|nr:hypothetical protein K438DRAFT_1862636 [Mycena galopus ATCC 62051]
MVLTRRAYKSISRWLPNEVICEIIQAARPSDQAALCRTSKLFHSLGVPVLYRVVELRSYASIRDFCSVVLANAAKFAGLVRSLTASMYTVSPWPRNLDDPGLFDCCKILLKIENLSFEGHELHKMRQQLLSSTFPCLVGCTLSVVPGVPWTSAQQDTIASFLTRHTALKSIRIEKYPSEGYLQSEIQSWPSTSARIPLLNLQHLRAPPKLLFAIITTRLKEVRLTWEKFEPVEPTFTALRSLTRSEIPFICSIRCWHQHCEEIVESFSKHMPHTRTLQMSVATHQPPDVFLACFTRCLSSFTALECLSLCTNFSDQQLNELQTEDRMRQIKGLGDECPTLQACRLSWNASRKVNGVWEKLSIGAFVEMAGISLV